MTIHPTAQKLATEAEQELGLGSLTWNEPIGGFIDADLPDGWTVVIRLDDGNTRVVDPQCLNSLTIKEYLQWKSR